MKTQSIDTSPEAERVLIEMIRKAPILVQQAAVLNVTELLERAIDDAGLTDV